MSHVYYELSTILSTTDIKLSA